jgi:acetylornithine/succinyldiaminopimelate/putrescine aminotransferase
MREVQPGIPQVRIQVFLGETPPHVGRFIMSITVADHTGSTYLNCFNDSAAQILGKSADEVMEFKEMVERAHRHMLFDTKRVTMRRLRTSSQRQASARTFSK